MHERFSENLFLTNETGARLYNAYAKGLPIIDYHCHLSPQEIYEDRMFEDIGEMWLKGDHYKWRAMRTFGIDESYITGGGTSFYEKYMKFAEALPYMAGNPVFIWCAMELKRFFGIDEPVSARNAQEIYDHTKRLIRENGMTRQHCMRAAGVEAVCTTDDPADSLEWHMKIKEEGRLGTAVLPAFRPDRAFCCEKGGFAQYVDSLARASGARIDSFASLIGALEKRLAFFKSLGAIVSDHGVERFAWNDGGEAAADAVFAKAMEGRALARDEADAYRTAFLTALARLYNKYDIVMQLHIGTYVDANSSQADALGPSAGFDCTDDSTRVRSVGMLLDRLARLGELPRTILYPLNPSQIETFAILAAAFCGGGAKAKVQLGAPWWFNDQEYGIRRQFQAVSNLYPVSLSVGMLTDSRSFLSYPRHELYRRVFCNYLGELIERKEYFAAKDTVKAVVQNVCYYNAKEFFKLEAPQGRGGGK